MTDDECLATVLLHGGHIWYDRAAEERNGTHWMRQHKQYYAIDAGFNERMPCIHPDGSEAYSTAESPAQAARAYCQRHGLLPEVIDAAS